MATVLVVDDKEMMRDSLSLALSRGGHKAVTTGDASEAVALVRQHRPACVITDLKMPKMDGLEVLRVVKQDPELKNIPIVVLTSSREEQDIVESYNFGVNAYVVKPVEFDRFVEVVKQLGLFWVVLNQAPVWGATAKA